MCDGPEVTSNFGLVISRWDTNNACKQCSDATAGDRAIKTSKNTLARNIISCWIYSDNLS